MDHFSGMHNWYACSHARPTYCNVCREALSGVTSHGLSCEGMSMYTHTNPHRQQQDTQTDSHLCVGMRACVCVCAAVCKFKAHKRCAVRATNNCKWTTLASIGKDIIEDEDGVRHTHTHTHISQRTAASTCDL